MKPRFAVCAALTLTLFGISATDALAQPSSAAVSAGYQLLHIPGETFPLGFNVDVTVPVAAGWTAVAEAGFAHDNSNTAVNTSLNFTNFGAGLRYVVGTGPFVQVLAGGVRTSANVTTNGVTVGASDTAFMLQPGIGVVVPIVGPFGAVAQGDYRRVFFSEGAENEFRLYLGLRVSIP